MARPVWFIRHGESVANAGRYLAGHLDVDLTARGVEQATALRAALADARPERLLASDLRRAWRTAELAWPHSQPPLERHEALRERDVGDWESIPLDELGASVRQALITWNGRPPNGESQAMLATRVLRWLAAHDDGRPTMLFVHGGLIRCIVGLLDGTPLHEIGTWKVRNTEVAVRDVPADRWGQLLRAMK